MDNKQEERGRDKERGVKEVVDKRGGWEGGGRLLGRGIKEEVNNKEEEKEGMRERKGKRWLWRRKRETMRKRKETNNK